MSEIGLLNEKILYICTEPLLLIIYKTIYRENKLELYLTSCPLLYFFGKISKAYEIIDKQDIASTLKE